MHLDCAAHRVHDAAELHDAAVAGSLDDAAVMRRDCWIDEVASEAPKSRERAVLVRAGEPAVADHIGDEDCRKFAGLAHRVPLEVAKLAQMPVPVCLFGARTAHVRIPSVPGAKREGQLRVEFGRSAEERRGGDARAAEPWILGEASCFPASAIDPFEQSSAI